MPISIHEAAETAFNERAQKLISTAVKSHPHLQQSDTFPSEVPVSLSISEQDITGAMEESVSDHNGRIIGRYFYIDVQRYALDGRGYEALMELAATVVRHGRIHDRLSAEYVEKVLFRWVVQCVRFPANQQTFCTVLTSASHRDIVKQNWWIPIANLEVEAEFTVGEIVIRPLSKAVIDTWSEQLTGVPEEYLKAVHAEFEKFRRQYQGRAAAYLVLESEPIRGMQLAIERTRSALSAMALFSAGAFLPDVKCLAKPSGCELLAQVTVLSEMHGVAGFTTTQAIVDLRSAQPWRLSQSATTTLMRSGLGALSGLLREQNLSQFKLAFLNGVLIYSKAAYSNEPIEKIIYILSFLESMLLKNENESIQQNLAERMAVVLSKELAERKRIIANIRAVYGIRSRYLHHGNEKSELDAVTDFMKNTWVFFTQVLGQLDKFQHQADFASSIDDAKLS